MSRIALLPRFAAAVLLALPTSFAFGAEPFCSLPGETVSEDEAGDPAVNGAVPDAVPGHDVLSLQVAEPADDKIAFTITVGASPAATPNTVYYAYFTADDGVPRYVSWNPYPVPGESEFEYGHTEPNPAGTGPGQLTADGTPDTTSTADPATGVITIVVSRSKVAGESTELTGVYADARALIGVLGTGLVTPVDESPSGFYEIRGYEACAKSGSAKSSTSALAAGSFGFGLLAPFALLGLRRRGAVLASLLALSGSAVAADPASGAVSPDAPTLSYALDIQPIANVSGLLSEVPGRDSSYDCTQPQFPCDEFELTVTYPEGFLDTHPDAIVRVAAATDNDQLDIDMQIKDTTTDKFVAIVRDNPPEQPTGKIPAKPGTTKYLVQVTPGTPHTGGSVTVTLEPGDELKSGSTGLLAAGSTGLAALLALGAAGLGRRFRGGR